MSEWADRHIAVTGASGGIGLATCAWLAERGATVYALDLQPTDAQVGEFVPCDVSDPDSVATATAAVLERAGQVHGLVAGAGIGEDDAPTEDKDPAVFDRVIGVNLRGVFLCAQAFARPMLAAGEGRIVAVSSMSGTHIVNRPQRQAAYNASKAAVSALVRSLAAEWGPRGVRVNTVAPGYVDTPLLANRPELHAEWFAETPLGRFAAPAEIAGAVGYLLSDAAGFCAGTELLIDGGYSLR